MASHVRVRRHHPTTWRLVNFFEFGFGCSLDERSLGQKTSFTNYNTIERRPLFRFDSSAVVGKVCDKLLFLANCVNQSWRFENINLFENDSWRRPRISIISEAVLNQIWTSIIPFLTPQCRVPEMVRDSMTTHPRLSTRISTSSAWIKLRMGSICQGWLMSCGDWFPCTGAITFLVWQTQIILLSVRLLKPTLPNQTFH